MLWADAAYVWHIETLCRRNQWSQWPPPLPWSKLGADLCELDNQHFLIMVDYYSNFIEVAEQENDTVISEIKENIARYGIMDTLVSDNGSIFAFQQFKDFTRANGIQHTTSSPLHPHSSCLAEKAFQTVKSILKICTDSEDDLHLALLDLHSKWCRNWFPSATFNVQKSKNVDVFQWQFAQAVRYKAVHRSSPAEKPKVTPKNQSTVDQKSSSPLAKDVVQISRSGRTLVRPKYLSVYTIMWFGEMQWNQCIVWTGYNNQFISMCSFYIVVLSPNQWLSSQLFPCINSLFKGSDVTILIVINLN